jgi:hypothetical protein
LATDRGNEKSCRGGKSVRLEISHRYIVDRIIITVDGAIDVLGYDIDIYMMAIDSVTNNINAINHQNI